MQKTASKLIFGLPIAFFFGIGILISTDIIQPSYFKNVNFYWPYFLIATLVGYLSIFSASSYIESLHNRVKQYVFMSVFMIVEALFAYVAVSTYYGETEIPLIRILSTVSLPIVFSLFYFLKIIDDEKTVKILKDENTIFKEFDNLESNKPDL
jgi:heme/copper-type cytochrome/quinol oxidase subunit 4